MRESIPGIAILFCRCHPVMMTEAFSLMYSYTGLPGWLSGKEWGLIPGLGISPGEENGNPLHYSCLENPHGQRNLAGYSAWGRKESDTTEQINNRNNNILT